MKVSIGFAFMFIICVEPTKAYTSSKHFTNKTFTVPYTHIYKEISNSQKEVSNGSNKHDPNHEKEEHKKHNTNMTNSINDNVRTEHKKHNPVNIEKSTENNNKIVHYDDKNIKHTVLITNKTDIGGKTEHMHKINEIDYNRFFLYLRISGWTSVIHAILYLFSKYFSSNISTTILGSFLLMSSSLYVILTSTVKQNSKLPFHIQSSVFCSEAIKFIIMFIFSGISKFKNTDKNYNIVNGKTETKSILLIALPAFLFTVQNNLLYFALSYIDANDYQMFNTLKIIFTGIIGRVVLKKKLTYYQYFALVNICIGVAISHICEEGTKETLFIGISIVCFIQVIAAIALVVNEYILTHSNHMSFYQKNVFIYMFGMIFNYPFIKFQSIIKFDIVAWSLIVYLAIIGISIAFIILYVGANVRNLIQAGSLIFTNIVLQIEREELPDKTLVFSTLIVVLATIQFFK